MKKVLGIITIGAAIFVAGCGPNPSLYRKMFFPVNKIVKAGPIHLIKVDGPSSVSVGETFEVSAEALDINGRKVSTDYTWKADDNFELMETKGDTIKAKAIAAGTPAFISVNAG
ncbi:MAG: hypothetical protein U9R36_04455, partial [Elusimicrobiota bacterium]|nr:hypothetical protein [Elusimicrobiota bacterium]